MKHQERVHSQPHPSAGGDGSSPVRFESRKARAAFVARGLASGARARSSGQYVPASKVIGELRRRLAREVTRFR